MPLADLAVLGAVEQRRRSRRPKPGGASWACSSAMRQLLRNLPPRMVSPKWTCQLSLLLTLRMAAAQPSAITVWALPLNSDLVTTATRRPRSRASITAQTRAAGTDHYDVVGVPLDPQQTCVFSARTLGKITS